MVRLRVTKGFYDREAGKYRPTGEIFDVTDARAAVILAAGVAEVVEVLATPAEEIAEKPEEKPKKRKKG